MLDNCSDIRERFRALKKFSILRGNDTLEIQGVSFIADEPTIFGSMNFDYVKAEIEWYESQDLRVSRLFEIYGKEVKIWKDIANPIGEVNSNYGYCIYSRARGNQYNNCLDALVKNKLTRQAIMLYQHHNMHDIAGKDFTCTNAVQYFYNKPLSGIPTLDAIVQMRSNDVVFGYINDRAWQRHVLNKLVTDLNYEGITCQPGQITWQVGSLHVYKRHWDLI